MPPVLEGAPDQTASPLRPKPPPPPAPAPPAAETRTCRESHCFLKSDLFSQMDSLFTQHFMSAMHSSGKIVQTVKIITNKMGV